MRTRRTTKRTTQALATPMTGVQVLEAGRRAYEAVAAGSADATPAVHSAAPSAPQSRCERNLTKPGPICLPPKKGDRKGE